MIVCVYSVFCLIAYVPLSNAAIGIVDTASSTNVGQLVAWAMIAVPINVAGIAQLSAIDGIGRADIRSIINIVSVVIFGICAAVFIPSQNILGLAYAQIAQYVFALIAARAVLVRYLEPVQVIPTRFSASSAREALHYGMRLQATSIPMAIFDPMTRILLGRWVGLDYLGVYDLSYKLAGYTRALVQAGLTPIVPEFTRLLHTDIDTARALHARISAFSIFVVSGAFTLLILASPLLSLFLLSELSPVFLFSTSVLALGWGISSFGLATQLYARAGGILRWSLIGQWSLLAFGAGMGFTVANLFGAVWTSAAIALAITAGHLIAFVGETRQFSLIPFGPTKLGAPRIVAAGFILLGVVAAGVSGVNVAAGDW